MIIMEWKNRLIYFFKKFYIIIFLVVIYLPMILIVLISFCGQTDRGNIIYGFNNFSGENYPALFEENSFINALLGSIVLGLTTTPIVVVIATITCFGIWRSSKIQTAAVLNTSNITIVTPDAITGISLLLLFTSTFIPLGIDLGFFTVVLAHVSFGVPYAIIAIYPRMTKMKVNTILASYDLGAGKILTFFKIVIPYLMPGIVSGAILAFAMSLDDYVITNLVNGSFQTIGVAIYSTRKGIKAWVVTFGAIIVLLTFVIIAVKTSFVFYRNKKNNLKNIMNKIGDRK